MIRKISSARYRSDIYVFKRTPTSGRLSQGGSRVGFTENPDVGKTEMGHRKGANSWKCFIKHLSCEEISQKFPPLRMELPLPGLKEHRKKDSQKLSTLHSFSFFVNVDPSNGSNDDTKVASRRFLSWSFSWVFVSSSFILIDFLPKKFFASFFLTPVTSNQL